jgi:F-type H+-transporting ATPase subunit b
MLLSFSVVFFVLAKYGLPIVLGSVQKRKEYIEQSVKAAQEANERLGGIQAEGEQLLLDARSRQQEIIAEAMAEKQKIVKAAQEEASTEAHRIAEEAARRIDAAREEALKDVHDEVAGLALQIAEQVIRQKMQDDAEQRAAVERLLEDF